MTSGLYRWSKKTVNEWPSIVIPTAVLALSRVYIAEGALFRVSEVEDYSRGQDNPSKLITVSELSLLWVIYAVGMAIASCVVIIETGFLRWISRK